jgi:hypothetical protein
VNDTGISISISKAPAAWLFDSSTNPFVVSDFDAILRLNEHGGFAFIAGTRHRG